MYKTSLIVCMFVGFSPSKLFAYDFSSTEPFQCKENPELVGECFTVHGRVTAANGAPYLRLWIVGTNRMLGVSLEGEGVPDCALEHIKIDRSQVYGDFLLCPFTEDRPGWMRYACIESASNLVVERLGREPSETFAYFPEVRSCALNQ